MKKTSKKRLIIRIIVMILAGTFLGLRIYSWNASGVGGDEMPMPLGFGASVVLTGSMEPELSANDLIFVTEQDSYSVGDVVVYQSYGSLIVHRIIEINGEEVITQGDANNTPDQPIKLSDIKGEVAWKISYVGVVLNFIKSPLGVVIILAAAFLLMELSYRKEKRDSYSELDDIKAEIRRLQSEFAAEQSPQPKEEIKQEPENKDS